MAKVISPGCGVSSASQIEPEELEFFSSADESLIGVLIKDLTDRDFGYVLLGRDRKGRFRCIDLQMSLKQTEARHALFVSVDCHLAEGKTVFDQGVTEISPAITAGMPAPNNGWGYRSFRLNGVIGGATPRGPSGYLRARITQTP